MKKATMYSTFRLVFFVLSLLLTQHVIVNPTTSQRQSPVKYKISTLVPLVPNSGMLGMSLYENQLYIADALNHVIQRVTISNRNVLAVVGTGVDGYSFNGPALATAFNKPASVRVANGIMFIADSVSGLIRKVPFESNFVTTIAGTYSVYNFNQENVTALTGSLNSPNAIFPISEDEFYISENQLNKIRSVKNQMLRTITGKYPGGGSNTGDGGLAVLASIDQPTDVFVRNGKIFIAVSNSIRVINETGNIYTLCVTGATGGQSIYVTADLTVYVTDRVGLKIYRISNNGTMTTIAGTGVSGADAKTEALESNVDQPTGIAFNELTGVMYFAEYTNKKIRTLTPYCESGFTLNEFKTECVTYMCYGIESSNNGSVCSGNGTCDGTNKCTCKNGYGGEQCNLVYCYGVLSNDTQNVCSGHGICGDIDNCNCRQGYSGAQCQIYYCNNKERSNAGVCSGNGNCTATNVCKCRDGYSGQDCEIYSCFGITSNTSNVCSGNGNCTQLNICNCNANYTGASCSNPLCYRISSTLPNVCSGNGVCISPNVCSCRVEYFGLNCENQIEPAARAMKTMNLPRVVVRGVNSLLDFNVLNVDLRPLTDLKNSSNECTGQNCTVLLKYTIVVSENEKPILNSPAQDMVIGTFDKPIYTDRLFRVTFSPVISFKNQLVATSNNVTITLTISNVKDESISISQQLLVISPPSRNSSIPAIIQPLSGTSLKTNFTIKESTLSWSFTDPNSVIYLLPLKYAFGFKYKNEIIRISQFTTLGQNDIYLPYTNETSISQNQTVELFVICSDAFNNEYYEKIGTVSISANFDESAETLKSRMASIASVFPYDTSLRLRIEDLNKISSLIVESINNINIDISNPSTALSNLKQVTVYASLNQVASAINGKLENYLVKLNEIFKNEKETLGYITKQRISNSDLMATLTSASNLLSFGFSNVSNTCNQLSTVLLSQEGVKILSDSFSPSVFSSDLINVTVSSFIKSGTSTKLEKFSDISLDSDYILTKYNGFNKQVGLSLISYSNPVFNSNQTQLTNSKDFTLFMEGKSLPLSELTKPILINFVIQNQTFNSLNSSQIKCKFWNETTLQWDSNGCSLNSLQSTGELTCQCSHTTLFAAFIENSLNNTNTDLLALQQLSSLYIAQISFGVLFLILSTSIFIGLIVMRKSQPLASRFVTPFIGMIALMVECIFLLITQRSILLAATNGLTFSLKSVGLTESTVIQLENGNLAANIVSNIFTIIVNTLTLTAMFSYLYQTLRFHILKYFYHQLSIKFSLNDNNSSQLYQKGDKILKWLRIFLSTRAMLITMSVFIMLNIIYWTVWVILVRVEAITGVEYSYIVSISFTVTLLSLGFMICALIILDMIMSLLNIKKEKDMISDNDKSMNNISSSSISSLNKDASKFDTEEAKKIAKTPLLKAYDWFIKLDTPLYFRMEMTLFVICFTFLVISQIIGLSGLSYKRGDTTSRVNDSISLLFEILYLFTYLFVFGGFALLVRFVHFIKLKNRKQSNDSTSENSDADELSELLSNTQGLKLFESFCEKEYSLENLHLHLELKHNQHLIQFSNSKFSELTSFIENIFKLYIENGSVKEVNIPSECKNQFKKIALSELNCNGQELKSKNESGSSESIQESVKESIGSLQDQILVNLSDTFTRFILTNEFELYENSLQTRKQLMIDSKLTSN